MLSMISNISKKVRNLKWEEIKEGDTADFLVEITPAVLENFTKLSGDINPLHNDQLFAKSQGFADVVAPGIFLASFFSQLVGVHLPGLHALYLSQTLHFRKPAFLGETVKVSGIVKKKVEAVQLIYLTTQIVNQNNEIVVEGEAIVKFI